MVLASCNGSETAEVWDINELLLAFPVLNETSFIKIDTDPWPCLKV